MAHPVPRLLQTVIPEHYDLHFDLKLDEFTFIVDQKVTFELVKASTKLVMHASGLDIIRAEHADGTPARTALDVAGRTVTFEFDEELPAGRHTLEVTATGTINDTLHGVYRSHYKDELGRDAYLAVTQFEAIHAREAFVCVDEPAAKATFDISLTTYENQTALANTPEIRELTLDGGRVRHDFETTPRMSTYLVAFVVGELEAATTRTPEDVTVRAYATPGRAGQLRFALDVAARALSFYTEYFGTPYPLRKLDMVAVPDFGAGAMENWGLITYRETALLSDDAENSLATKRRVAEVVAHELAHQWFGNLVTMAWWNDLWLNEGFASWAEVLAQDALFPEWRVWTEFAATHYARAMELDALVNTHAIEVDVPDPLALDEIFDAVSYSKGASIIHMLHHYLGADVFRDGLRAYLKTYAYGNATTADLWAALETASGQPVALVMAAWTSQPGYPIVSLAGGTLHQRRFMAAGPDATTDHKDMWPVPIRGLRDDLSTTLVQLLNSETAPAGRELGASLKLNPGQTGFYRVDYDTETFGFVYPRLVDGTLPAVDRLGVTSDVYAGAEAGYGSARRALELTAALRGETDYVVWSALTAGYGDLRACVEDDTLRPRLDAFGRWLVSANLARLGWDERTDDDHFDRLLRPLVLRQAVSYDDETTILESQRRLEAGDTPADLRSAVYAGVARRGDEVAFDRLLESYRSTTDAQERMRLLGGLCAFRAPELADRILALTFSEDVRPQDAIYVLAGAFANRSLRHAAWRFMRDEWSTLTSRYGGGGHMLEYLPGFAGKAFASEADADAVANFFAANPHPGLERPVAQAIETIKLKATRFQCDHTHIVAFLDSRDDV